MMPDTPHLPKTTSISQAEWTTLEPFFRQCLSINHDLNNPLSGILGYAEFLLEESEGMSAEQLDYVKQIINCAERISSLMADFCEAKDELAEKIDLDRLLKST
jgi:signal transduction histidine kinase